MDSILSLAVTGLVDHILGARQPSSAVICDLDPVLIDKLDRHQARDLLTLAACYDQSTAETFKGRWHRLRRRLKFPTWRSYWPLILAWSWTIFLIVLVAIVVSRGGQNWLPPWWVYPILLIAGWLPWLWSGWKNFWLARGVLSRMRVGIHETNPLRQVLMQFSPAELSGQPLPNKDSTD